MMCAEATEAPATPMSAEPALPAEYGDALKLVRGMLAATLAGDTEAASELRRRIPALARSLASRWQELTAEDPRAAHRLEPARLAVIREILAVDARLRRLESPRLAAVGDLIAGRRSTALVRTGNA